MGIVITQYNQERDFKSDCEPVHTDTWTNWFKAIQALIDSSSATIRKWYGQARKAGLVGKGPYLQSDAQPGRLSVFCQAFAQSGSHRWAGYLSGGQGFDFEAFKLRYLAEGRLCSQAELNRLFIRDFGCGAGQTKLTFDIASLSSHDAPNVLTLDESKPATVQFTAFPKFSWRVIC